MIKIKRVYEPWNKNDGTRILIDRLWPRGITKEDAHIYLWLKDIAPDNQLRKWFNHDPKKWEEFKKQYQKELKENIKSLDKIRKLETKNKAVTLLYGAKDPKHNNALVVLEFLKNNS